MKKWEITSSISSLGKYTTWVLDVVLYEFYERCIFQYDTQVYVINYIISNIMYNFITS